jgi:hypothetical protein
MKRIIAGAFAALLSLAALAATTTPVQLLSPTGSTAGQAIVSNGPSSPPTWGSVALTGITGTLAIANGGTGSTSASAARTALGLGSMATQNANTVAITGGTGAFTTLSANTLNASGGTFGGVAISGSTITTTPISGASASFTTVSASGLISPSSTIGIKATVTNDSAQAGSVGESATNSTSGTALTTGVTANATSVPLAAGNWMVQCSARFVPAASTVLATIFTSVSTTSATNGAFGSSTQIVNSGFVNGQQQIINSPVVNIKLASAGTVYCPSYAGFTTSTLTVDGVITAWRPR